MDSCTAAIIRPVSYHTTRNRDELCVECQRHNWQEVLTTKPVYTTTRLTCIRENAQSCHGCAFLWSLILMNVIDVAAYSSTPSSPNAILRIQVHLTKGRKPARCRFLISSAEPTTSRLFPLPHSLVLESRWRVPPSIDDAFTGRVPGPFVDTDLLVYWLRDCNKASPQDSSLASKHGLSCLRVIEVRRRCIVRAPDSCRFLALSYVWGSVLQPLLLRANCDAMSKDGALDRLDLPLPLTIRDAIQLCNSLGEQYLWVDSLCLLQDQHEDNPDQIADMGLVYAAAAVTIVAATGDDSNAGLPGIGHARQFSHLRITIDGIRFITTFTKPVHNIKNSIWNSRAWTLQEQYLSSKMFVFGTESVAFMCKDFFRLENVVLETNVSKVQITDEQSELQTQTEALDAYYSQSDSAWLRPTAKMQDIKRAETEFCRIWLLYISRSLSHHSDMLNAFSGIMGLFKATLGPFFWGHPVSRFQKYFMWSALAGKDYQITRVTDIPSWSWAGWHYPHSGLVSPTHAQVYDPPVSFLLFYRLSDRPHFVRVSDRPVGATGRSFWQGREEAMERRKSYDTRLYAIETRHLRKHFTISPAYFTFAEISALVHPHLRKMVIGFSTSTAKLFVSTHSNVESGKSAMPVFLVMSPQQKVLGSLQIDEAWRASQPQHLDFIIAGTNGGVALDDPRHDSLVLMLVEWVDGIAYRVGVAGSVYCDRVEWLSCEPEGKFVIMA